MDFLRLDCGCASGNGPGLLILIFFRGTRVRHLVAQTKVSNHPTHRAAKEPPVQTGQVVESFER